MPWDALQGGSACACNLIVAACYGPVQSRGCMFQFLAMLICSSAEASYADQLFSVGVHAGQPRCRDDLSDVRARGGAL